MDPWWTPTKTKMTSFWKISQQQMVSDTNRSALQPVELSQHLYFVFHIGFQTVTQFFLIWHNLFYLYADESCVVFWSSQMKDKYHFWCGVVIRYAFKGHIVSCCRHGSVDGETDDRRGSSGETNSAARLWCWGDSILGETRSVMWSTNRKVEGRKWIRIILVIIIAE